jgi:hypothetical protein
MKPLLTEGKCTSLTMQPLLTDAYAGRSAYTALETLGKQITGVEIAISQENYGCASATSAGSESLAGLPRRR